MSDAAEIVIMVDGERSIVHPSQSGDGGYDFDWVSGPNAGYGFSSGAPVDYAHGDHARVTGAYPGALDEYQTDRARSFLSMIDPATGYVAD